MAMNKQVFFFFSFQDVFQDLNNVTLNKLKVVLINKSIVK